MPTGRGGTPSLGQRHESTGGRPLIVLVILSIVLITWSARTGAGGPLGVARSAFQTVTSPVRYVGSLVLSPITGLGNVIRNLTADQQTLSELQEENERLRIRNVELEEAALTAERLQGLLDLKDAYSLQSTAARIISGSTDSWSSTVIIDKGTSSGIAVGMPVCDANGAIGQVVECGPSTSTVRLITDEGSGVAAMVQSSRAQGMVEGTATGQLRLTLIRVEQSIEVGDVVVTSGLGGVFPKGLPIGEVIAVERTPGAMYYDVVVEPFAHVENLEEVLVITSLTEGQQASAEDIAEADAQEAGVLPEGVEGESAEDDTAEDASADAQTEQSDGQ